ncbi:hypothetical protein NM688_g311 [Phlebia brevispora]|uniref:Uncharacterized protein n=1 Tax=Phlebia brevispora TaxID=194682 RepID=A0ACC1TEG6_9APHY|nr:hypothetical protein NM688_g311 [Phlebia brevispora]
MYAPLPLSTATLTVTDSLRVLPQTSTVPLEHDLNEADGRSPVHVRKLGLILLYWVLHNPFYRVVTRLIRLMSKHAHRELIHISLNVYQKSTRIAPIQNYRLVVSDICSTYWPRRSHAITAIKGQDRKRIGAVALQPSPYRALGYKDTVLNCSGFASSLSSRCVSVMIESLSTQLAAADISSSDYAKRTRSLINLITDLRALGAQADFDLPRIAVIGNQSAGKSSLVEAISGITVPRASGTCTRCPMECRLIHSNRPWQCQVLLRKETDENGNKIPAKEVPFGPLLHDKTQLEEMLRRAQLAVLNPSVSPSLFENFDTKSLKPGEKPLGSVKQLAFSDDVVCLDLQAPEVTDLSFIDLPGIISNVASGEDRGNIEAVKSMVKEHIKGNTLILLTITMRDDIDNQGAAFLAHEEDEKGLRTIGVLTKPDTIQHGEEQAWLSVLEGASHPLKHGYFVTKQPSPKELEEKISFETARQRERAFFEGTAPWSDRTTLRNRMGTPNLTKELSRLLGNVINQAFVWLPCDSYIPTYALSRLPGLRKESKESYQDVRQQLDNLPPPPSDNPSGELLRLVTTFSTDVEHLIQGRESYQRLIQRCRPAYTQFRYDIRRTAPKMRPFEKADYDTGETFDVVSEGGGGLGVTSMLYHGKSAQKTGAMYLRDVRTHIQSSLTRQLPYNVPFEAKVSLIERIFKEWDQYSTKCFDLVHNATLEEVKDLIDLRFGRYTTSLPDQIATIMENVIERASEKTRERIEWMLQLEDPPFTLNDHYFSTYREKYLARYKEARKASSPRNTMGYAGLEEADLARLRGPDPYEEELIVMAETSAYFHIAYKRIIDNIPRIMVLRWAQSMPQRGQGMYLAEDEQIASQRVYLKQKKERLESVLKKLYDFGM